MTPEVQRIVEQMQRNNDALRQRQSGAGTTKEQQIQLLIETLNKLKG